MAWAGPAASGRQLESLFKNRPRAQPDQALAVGILSAHPSMHCGEATFVASLAAALVAGMPLISVDVVQLLPTYPFPSDPLDDSPDPPPVTAVNGREAARELNKFDVVVLQHEHGAPGEEDAEELLDIVDRLLVPVVLVVPAVLAEPTAHQRYVLELLALSAGAVVTMSPSAQRRLLDDYRVEPRMLTLIPHGMPAHVNWSTVAGEYRRVFDSVVRPSSSR